MFDSYNETEGESIIVFKSETNTHSTCYIGIVLATVMMRNILLTLQLVFINSALSENIMGGEGLGGVMWFVR